jgi:hypothetical protein
VDQNFAKKYFLSYPLRRKKMEQQLNEVKKSSNVYIGATFAIIIVILAIGFIFG